jgi:monoamine oxidase
MKKTSALVIGGGIAGLAAALELARNKISVTLLEAKNRFGGRIHTLREHSFPVELGAEFVHGRSKPLIEAIRQAKLSLQSVQTGHRIFQNGKFQDLKIWNIIGDILNRIDSHKPDCSFEKFLAGQKVGEPARTLVRHFVMGFDAADPDRISAHALKRAEYSAEHMEGDQQSRVVEGYSPLVDYFTNQVGNHGGRLMTNVRVRRLRWEKGNVEVLAEEDGRQKLFSAEAAIVTLPLGVLKTDAVKFEPSLPEKVEAIRELQVGNVVRIIFHFKDLSWDNFGFIHAPAEPIPTWWSDPRGPVLIGWAGGPIADALLKFSDKQLETMGLEILAKTLFGLTAAALRKKLVKMYYFNWTADPDICGAYSYIPVNGLDLPKVLAAPVADTLFLAGEATVMDAQTGTVFGALESGLRAAKEVMTT